MCDQQRLRPACAYAQTDQSLCLSLEYSMIVKLLTEHHFEFLSLEGGCRGSSESTHVKMSNRWKSRATAQLLSYQSLLTRFLGHRHRQRNFNFRDQARGRLGRNGRPGGRNVALNGTQGEVGVSLKKKKKNFFFFFRETHFHSVTTQMQAVVTLSDNLLPLHRVSPSIKWQ